MNSHTQCSRFEQSDTVDWNQGLLKQDTVLLANPNLLLPRSAQRLPVLMAEAFPRVPAGIKPPESGHKGAGSPTRGPVCPPSSEGPF